MHFHNLTQHIQNIISTPVTGKLLVRCFALFLSESLRSHVCFLAYLDSNAPSPPWTLVASGRGTKPQSWSSCLWWKAVLAVFPTP